MNDNIGVVASNGGIVNARDVIVATDNHNVSAPRPTGERTADGRGVDVGILAVLDDEMRAVVEQLQRYSGYRSRPLTGGARAHEAQITTDGNVVVRVAALQHLRQGQLSAVAAFQLLQTTFRPRIVLLVGIAGAVHDDVSIGDVVIGDEVIYYDARRETSEGPRRRGQSQQMTAFVQHRLHDYFVRYGDSVPVDADGGTARVFRGPIGSGDAVINDRNSEIIEWLRRFNEKVLAVETEASGLGEGFFETVGSDPTLQGWFTVRGISDQADTQKCPGRKYVASCRAVLVVDRLLPLLGPDGAEG